MLVLGWRGGDGDEASLAIVGECKRHNFCGDPLDGATGICAQGLADAEEEVVGVN